MDLEKLITVEDLAKQLKVSKRTIRNYQNQGLPTISFGRRVYFYKDDVARWILKRNKELSDGK